MDRRCKARTGQSPVVSTQTGAVAYSQGVGDGYASSSFPGETTFAADGTIYANGEVINALDPATYATKWKWGSRQSPPVVSPNGAVIVMDPTVTPGLVSLNPATGAVNWSLNGTVYFAETSGSGVAAVAVTAAGALRWKKVLGPALDPSSPGSYVTIAPSGHLAITAAANSTFYLLGP
jgi:outer membrane protein assembly factor BamB